MRYFLPALLFLAFPVDAWAQPRSDTDVLVAAADELRLDEHPVWLKLLHFEGRKKNAESLILSPGFFLAEDGRTSPRSELVATISAWFEPETPNPNAHPRCLFPARYYWLASQIPMPRADTAPECERLENWAKFDQLDSVSLMMISANFGNPASSFGHILLKLNNGDVGETESLLDLGINFGALVPENEPVVKYIWKGLTGGYEAGFSDQDFYRHDLTYSRTEFRDMWEYQLDLDPFQTRLLLYHLWEIADKKFKYYFLKENCAYRLAELLELVTGEDILSGVDLWYAPVAVFNSLRAIDKKRSRKLIHSVEFVPSSQRVLYAKFTALTKDERKRLNLIIAGPADMLASSMTGLEPDRQLQVLDALLAYYQYRLAGNENSQDPAVREAKDRALLYRLRLPSTEDRFEPDIKPVPPPPNGAGPSLFGIGGGYNEIIGDFATVSYAAFNYDGIGNNSLNGSALTVFDLSLLVRESDGAAALDEFNLIRARKLNLNTADIAGESKRSWEIAVGARREGNDCFYCPEAFLDGNIGRAFKLPARITAFATLGLSLSSEGEYAEAVPRFGLILDTAGRWNTEFEYAYKYGLSTNEDEEQVRLRSRFSITQNHEFRLDVEERGGLKSSLQYVVRW